MIQVGETIPAVEVTVAGAEGHKKINAVDLFAGKKSRAICFAGGIYADVFSGTFTRLCGASG